MENLLKIVKECADKFSDKFKAKRLAAIIGGEAVILHGIPRTTLDMDILIFFGDEENYIPDICRKFAEFLRKELGERFIIESFNAARDPSDPTDFQIINFTRRQG